MQGMHAKLYSNVCLSKMTIIILHKKTFQRKQPIYRLAER